MRTKTTTILWWMITIAGCDPLTPSVADDPPDAAVTEEGASPGAGDRSCVDAQADAVGTFAVDIAELEDRRVLSCQRGGNGEYYVDFTAPAAATYGFAASRRAAAPAVVALLETCDGRQLDCTGSEATGFPTLEMAAGDHVLVALGLEGDGAEGTLSLDIFDTATEGSCRNGVDEDADGDLDCADVDCVDDPVCGPEVCDDGFDNDGDAELDCADADCRDALACCAPDVARLGRTTANTDRGDSRFEPECGRSEQEADVAWQFTPPADGEYVLSTRGSDFGTILSVLETCGGPTLACDEGLPTSQLVVDLDASQTYVVVVDGNSALPEGNVDLSIVRATPVEVDCFDGGDNDADGQVDCLDSDCASLAACSETDCADGIDNDQDGAADCRDEECALSPACPETCDNGIDDDGDLDVDCVDAACTADPQCCPLDLVSTVPATITGDLTLTDNVVRPSCSGPAGADYTVEFTAPADGDYRFTFTNLSFTFASLAIYDRCGGAELQCGAGGLERFLLAGQTVMVAVDAQDPFLEGPFALDITATP